MSEETWQQQIERKNRIFSGLSVRTKNCLWNSLIETKEQAAQITDAELLRIPNFGRKSLSELRAWLAGCTPEKLEAETRRGLLVQRVSRAKGELQRAQEKVRWLEAQLAAYDAMEPA